MECLSRLYLSDKEEVGKGYIWKILFAGGCFRIFYYVMSDSQAKNVENQIELLSLDKPKRPPFEHFSFS